MLELGHICIIIGCVLGIIACGMKLAGIYEVAETGDDWPDGGMW